MQICMAMPIFRWVQEWRQREEKKTHTSPLGWLKQYNKSLNSCIIRWGLQKTYDKQRNTPTEKKWNAQHTKSNQVWYDACVFQLSSKFASLILLFFSFPPIFRLFFSVVCKFYSLSASSMFVFSRRWLWMSFAIHWWIPRNGGDDTTGILYLQVAKIHHIQIQRWIKIDCYCCNNSQLTKTKLQTFIAESSFYNAKTTAKTPLTH